MDGKFTLKDRFVVSGHTNDPHASLIYSSIVFRYSVPIEFTLDTIDDIDIWACDIGNAQLNENSRKNIWTKSGTEFVNEKG